MAANVESMFYVISNKSSIKGASAILNKKVLKEFAQKLNISKFLVLPSSVHEMLLLPYTDEIDIEEFSQMVKEVNCSQVKPEERLTDRAYVIEI